MRQRGPQIGAPFKDSIQSTIGGYATYLQIGAPFKDSIQSTIGGYATYLQL